MIETLILLLLSKSSLELLPEKLCESYGIHKKISKWFLLTEAKTAKIERSLISKNISNGCEVLVIFWK